MLAHVEVYEASLFLVFIPALNDCFQERDAEDETCLYQQIVLSVHALETHVFFLSVFQYYYQILFVLYFC